MGPVGVQEMVVIFLVALVMFGPKKLPELGKTIAKAVTEFRRAQTELKATFEREMQSIERENEALKEATRQAAVEISGYSDFDLISGNSHYAELPSASTPAPSSTVSATEPSGAEQQAGPNEPAPNASASEGSAQNAAAETGSHGSQEIAGHENGAGAGSPGIRPVEGIVPRGSGPSSETSSAPSQEVAHTATPQANPSAEARTETVQQS